jgi:hypothetical protein
MDAASTRSEVEFEGDPSTWPHRLGLAICACRKLLAEVAETTAVASPRDPA